MKQTRTERLEAQVERMREDMLFLEKSKMAIRDDLVKANRDLDQLNETLMERDAKIRCMTKPHCPECSGLLELSDTFEVGMQYQCLNLNCQGLVRFTVTEKWSPTCSGS